jgi:hypothetical protein
MPSELIAWLSAGTPLAIISAFVYAIMRGHLVPKSTVDEVRKDRDSRLTEQGQLVDMWKNAALVKDQALTELVPMMERAAENDKLVLQLLTAIRKVVDTRSGDQVG